MATAAVSLDIEEYLKTSYSPDREYIDGELLEKNVGKWEHSRVQWLLAKILSKKEDEWGVLGSTEQRTRVGATRVRIPDVVLVRAGQQQQVLTAPPLLVIEILSPDDSYADTQRRASDYLAMGVEAVWVIDPETRTGRQCIGDSWTAASVLRVPGTPVELGLDDLFARLDESSARS